MVKILPKAHFLKSFKDVPRVSISLLITNKNGEFLLARRNIEPFKNKWHLPGSFILKGEEFDATIKRILEKELGLKLVPNTPKLLNIFNATNKDPRGHVIDIIYGFELPEELKLETTDETREIHFFDKLPENLAFHNETLRKLGYS